MFSSTSQPTYEVLWPLARKTVRERELAPRLDDLSGKTIAEVWDYIFRGEMIFPEIRKHFKARFPGIKFVDYSEFGNFHGPKGREIVEALPAKLKRLGCDAVITGIGA